jgi:hypothetical protein
VAAAFDGAARLSADPLEVSRLATLVVNRVLVRGRRVGRATADRSARPELVISSGRGAIMLWILAFVLLAPFALGLVTSTTMGGLIHVLLAVAVIVMLLRAFRRQRAV